MRQPAHARQPMSERLAAHRALWQTKPVLRAVYEDCCGRLLEHCAPGGPTLEIGGGTGNRKALRADIVSSARASSSRRRRGGPAPIAREKTGKRA
jgi:hypothetical protein